MDLLYANIACITEPNPLSTESRSQWTIPTITAMFTEAALTTTQAIDSWITSVNELHRSKPQQSVSYSSPMPDIETLMQEWPEEFEALLKNVSIVP